MNLLRRPVLLVGLFAAWVLWFAPFSVHADAPDYDLPHGGHFYQQANGLGGQGSTGYAITNDNDIPFWDYYRRLGGPSVLGYPASRRFVWDGFTVQIMQKVVFQWQPGAQSVLMFLNMLDLLHDQGKDDWLLVVRMTPRPFDTSPDSGIGWNAVVLRHLAFLDVNPAIKERYFGDPNYIDHFGLPMSYADMGNAVVIRAQRVVFQYWKEDVPWARKGEVTIANGGDLLKEAGVIRGLAVEPSLPPTANHDWRAPGYVAAVGGKLYDPSCMPLVSVGISAPNLPFRDPGNTLQYMADRRLRWLRVFATGHGANVGPGGPPQNVESVIAALRTFLDRVEKFNREHPLDQAIYVLVSLTDYNDRGVPGDIYASDHPNWAGSVLPAPWFRSGVPLFDFNQEHDKGWLTNLPNYEVNYKPWVERIVESARDSPALMGWQLGNELKARGSLQLNNFSSDQAYGWYLGFTRRMVDIIRARDNNHLIFMGAQYMAELTDWGYRNLENAPNPHLVPKYMELVQRMLTDCGSSCWNVWGVTIYNQNEYAIDDARVFAAAGVATVAMEYGLDRPATRDVVAALQQGDSSSWISLDGQTQAVHPGALKLVESAPLAAIAPWGSPVPNDGAVFDLDVRSGITGTPEEPQLWATWAAIATQLEQANRAAGPSGACLAHGR